MKKSFADLGKAMKDHRDRESAAAGQKKADERRAEEKAAARKEKVAAEMSKFADLALQVVEEAHAAISASGGTVSPVVNVRALRGIDMDGFSFTDGNLPYVWAAMFRLDISIEIGVAIGAVDGNAHLGWVGSYLRHSRTARKAESFNPVDEERATEDALHNALHDTVAAFTPGI